MLLDVWFPGKEKQSKDKVLGQDILGHQGHQGPRRRISRTKTLCKWPFSVVLDTEWPGCPGISVGTSGFGKTSCKRTLGWFFVPYDLAQSPQTEIWTPSKNYPKDPAVLKIVRDSDLLRRSVFATPPRFTTPWTPLWEDKCLQFPGKWRPRTVRRDSKSLCGSQFTTPSKFTTA